MRIAVLGPKGTYSCVAADKYNSSYDKIYCRNFNEVFKALNEDTIGLIPYENSLDGFVQQCMDLLVSNDCTIIDELYLPISFKALGRVKSPNDIKRIFVQFKSKGQCLNFINQYPNADCLLTDSNMLSLERLENGIDGDIAIVPTHSKNKEFPFVIEDVTDSKYNQTRFLVIKKNKESFDIDFKTIKSTIVVTSINDRIGMLYEILGIFYKNNINLISIVSRPTKDEIGKYHFFIEVAGYDNKDILLKTIEEIKKNKDLRIRVLGIYENKDQTHSV